MATIDQLRLTKVKQIKPDVFVAEVDADALIEILDRCEYAEQKLEQISAAVRESSYASNYDLASEICKIIKVDDDK